MGTKVKTPSRSELREKVKTPSRSELREDAKERIPKSLEGAGQPTTTKSPAGARPVTKADARKSAAASKATRPKAIPRPKTQPSSKPAPSPNSRRSKVQTPAELNSGLATALDARTARGHHVARTRKDLGITQEIFARMIGASARSVAGWENGSPINKGSYRRVREMERLASSLKKVMKAEYISQWLVSPNEGMGGISPVQALESGENDRFWRSVFLLGSGLPL